MVILCNYISCEVLPALRRVNSLVLKAYLGERCVRGGEVMPNLISAMGDPEAPLSRGAEPELCLPEFKLLKGTRGSDWAWGPGFGLPSSCVTRGKSLSFSGCPDLRTKGTTWFPTCLEVSPPAE